MPLGSSPLSPPHVTPEGEGIYFVIPASPAHAGVSRGRRRVVSARDSGMRRRGGVCGRACRQLPSLRPCFDVAQHERFVGASHKRTHPERSRRMTGGFPSPAYPPDTPPRHTVPLLSQEPDQVPFWLWGAGSGGCGWEIRSRRCLGRSGQGGLAKASWESASSGSPGSIPGWAMRGKARWIRSRGAGNEDPGPWAPLRVLAEIPGRRGGR